jgi:O-antigen ligase
VTRSHWAWAGLLLFAAAVAAASTVAPQVLALPAIAVLVALRSSRRPTIALGLVVLLWLGIAPLPTVLPTGIELEQGTLLWSDVVSPVVAVWAAVLIARRRGAGGTLLGFAAFATVGLIGAAVGVAQHGDSGRLFGDLRPFLHLAAAGLGTAALILVEGSGYAMRVFGRFATAMILWTTAAVGLAAAGASKLFAVSGHSAALYAGSSTFVAAAHRFSPASGLFCELAAVVLLLAWLLRTDVGVPRPLVLVAVALGLVLTFVSYSRGFLLALGVAGVLLLLMLAPTLWRAKVRVLAVVGMVGFAALAAVVIVNFLQPNAVDSLQTSVNTYAARVLNGLDPSVIQVDASALWRVRESQAALHSIAAHPVIGTGFGVRYRPLLPGEIFVGSYGQTYIHNAYLWLLVKVGLLGTAFVACLAAALAVHCIRLVMLKVPAGPVLLALGCGIAVLSITSPTPWEDWNSLVVGCLAGTVAGVVARHRTSEQSSRSFAAASPVELDRQALTA